MSSFTEGTGGVLLSSRSVGKGRTLLSVGLTRGEWKVLMLVAQGTSDRDICDTLELARDAQLHRYIGTLECKREVSTRPELAAIYKLYISTVAGRAA